MRSSSLLHRLILIGLVLVASTALGAPRAAAQSMTPVFGLRGSLSPVTGQPYAAVIETPDGIRSAVSGSTPTVEARLAELAARGANVKVWGATQAFSRLSSMPLIVVTSVVEDMSAPRPPAASVTATEPAATTVLPTATAALTPGATRTPADVGPATATINAYAVYVREGPGGNFAPVGIVSREVVCAIQGRTPDGIWLQVECPALGGWVRQSYVTVGGSWAAVPFVTGPTPTLVATPTPVGSWRVLGYPNRDLSGPPVVTLETATVDFDWGAEPPNAALPADNFSLRLDRTLRFSPGIYQIGLTYDDGARLYLNGQMVINDWNEGAERTSVWQGALGGDVLVRIEYFDAYSDARLKFETLALQSVLPTSTPIPPLIPPQAPAGSWLATYFNNPELTEPVAFSRVEPRGDVYPLNYEFSVDSPVPGVISEDNWSARWRGRFFFDGGDYRFQARGNDGVRVYIDGVKLIDGWPNTTDTLSNEFRGVGAGEHEVTVEMYDAGGQAWVRAWWEPMSIPTATPPPTSAP